MRVCECKYDCIILSVFLYASLYFVFYLCPLYDSLSNDDIYTIYVMYAMCIPNKVFQLFYKQTNNNNDRHSRVSS